MWPWSVRITTEVTTDVTLVSEDTDDPDDADKILLTKNLPDWGCPTLPLSLVWQRAPKSQVVQVLDAGQVADFCK